MAKGEREMDSNDDVILPMLNEFKRLIGCVPVLKLVLCAIVFMFISYIWPTPYFYMKVQWGQTERIIEINRFTNETNVIYPN